MNKITVVAIAATLFGAPVCGAHAGSNTNGVLGFLTSNGTFRPVLTERATPKAAAAATIFSGRLTANFTFTISKNSNVPPTAPILCGLQASLFGTEYDRRVRFRCRVGSGHGHGFRQHRYLSSRDTLYLDFVCSHI